MATFAQLATPSTEGLPSSISAEIAILGAMLLDAVAISDATAASASMTSRSTRTAASSNPSST